MLEKRIKWAGVACYMPDCSAEVKSKGYCAKHYYRFHRHGDASVTIQVARVEPCVVILSNNVICAKRGYSKQMCKKHYSANKRYGNPLSEKKPPKTKRNYSYVYQPDHPNSGKDGYILEHRFVVSTHLNRPLMPGENVHHKNGNGKDNRLENLELWNTVQPAGQRIEDKVQYAIEILKLYDPSKLR